MGQLQSIRSRYSKSCRASVRETADHLQPLAQRQLVLEERQEPQEQQWGKYFSFLHSDDLEGGDDEGLLPDAPALGYGEDAMSTRHSGDACAQTSEQGTLPQSSTTEARLPLQQRRRKSSQTQSEIGTYLADATRNAYIAINNHHAAVTRHEHEATRRKQEVVAKIQPFSSDQYQLQLDQLKAADRLRKLDERESELISRRDQLRTDEEDLERRRRQLETATEPPLTRLRAALGQITDEEAVQAAAIMQEFQLSVMQRFQR